MALSDSMFLFEIIVEELKSFFNYKDYSILSQFADVFQVYLRNPNELETFLPKRSKKKVTKRSKVRVSSSKTTKASKESKVTIGQSVLIVSNGEALKDKMTKCPLELTFRSKYNADIILASNQIAWSKTFIDYLSQLNNEDMDSVTVEGKHSIFHEYTSKRMATIKLIVKLSCFKDNLTTKFRSLSEENQRAFMYSGFNSSPTNVLSILKENDQDIEHETGTIKTIYSGGKFKHRNSSDAPYITKTFGTRGITDTLNDKTDPANIEYNRYKTSRNKNLLTLIKSETELHIKGNQNQSLRKSQSCGYLDYAKTLNTLNYIFGDHSGPFGNQVYCVSYFTVQNDFAKDPVTPKGSSTVTESKSSENSPEVKEKYQFSLCSDECPNKRPGAYGSPSRCTLDLPKEASHLITVKKCDRVDCHGAKDREPAPPPDERLLVDLSSMKKFEEVSGQMTAKMQMAVGTHPCYCSCECTFGFVKKTTYCDICGGVEKFGEEKLGPLSFPCPIYHKLVDKNKAKTVSSGSDTKKKFSKLHSGDKSGESEKEKKGKKKKKDDRFKFNYGYTAPQIGHSQCAMPCTGTLGAVPKNMGWLWTAEDVPGMRFRPSWRPGAANKHVVRLLKIARNPDEALGKKRKREPKKKPLKRPLLIVHKKDGEFTITMETMKTYTKQRAINQQPYEEKPLVTYTIGRSEEENRERRRKKERVARRLERAQREFIQSAFKDMCQEICLKTYQQALGILPTTEDPECTCYPAEPGPDRTDLNRSCSCSEDSRSLGSVTDSDEWIVEFTPPNAYFDPTYKGKKVFKVEKETQYTYLDYRVKLVDRYGNPVPRFFKGPDGRQQCSDLGGFWSPEHEWLEINIDGYVAPDNRWAPMSFIGPNGEQVDAEEGKFQAANGQWLVVGVDGYIDCRGKWRFYPCRPGKKKAQSPTKKVVKKGETKPPVVAPSETTWSCFGDASPKELSKMGIIGHGLDRKLLTDTLKAMLARGEDVTIPQPSVVPRRPGSRKRKARPAFDRKNYLDDRVECKHAIPSPKGVTAVSARGNKTYYRLKDYKNKRPKERIEALHGQGISVSSFHVPCLHSFLNREVMMQQQQERLLAMSAQRQ